MLTTSSAPTRIDLAGGTYDIWPLYLFHDGAQTINIAISLRAHCSIAARADGRIAVESIDTGRSLSVSHWSELDGQSELRLLGRILHYFRAENLTLTTRAESPAGAGIAGSSALNVAVCGAMARFKDLTLTPEELLDIAKNVEAQAIAAPTGVQDYRPAMYGGVSAVELGVDGARRVEIPVDADALQQRLTLAYTGSSRDSGVNNWEIFKRHLDGDARVRGCFDAIRDAAHAIRAALTRGDWDEVARQIAAEWDVRKALAPRVSTPDIDALIDRARAAGAQAAKVCGAGGGGCLFCFGDPSSAPAVRRALSEGGARVLDFAIERDGLRVEDRDG